MFARISSFVFGGLLFGMLASFTSAQTPTIVPEKFSCTRSALTAMPQLIADLKSQDEKVRTQAIVTLGSLGPIAKEAAPALVEVAVNTRGHAAALVALTKIDDESTKKALRQLLVGGVGKCRCGNRFNDVVAAAGEPIVPQLIALLAEPTIASNAESVLAQIGTPAVPHLIRSLEDKNDAVRLAVCRSLTQMGPKAKAAAPALEKRLAIERGVLKLRVAQAVYTVTGSHQEAFEILHQAVKGNDKAYRLEALQCLYQMQSKSKVLVPTVLSLLMGDDPQYQGPATGVLIQIGADAVPALIDALSKSDAKYSERLMYNLQYIGVPAAAAVPTFIKILEGNDPRLASLSAYILPSFGPDAVQAVPHLLAALKTDSISFRLTCAESMVRIDRQQIPNVVAPLVSVLQSSNAAEQQRALNLLKSYGSQAKPAVPALLELLKTEKLAVRLSISDTLMAIDAGQSDAAMPSLIEALQAKQDPYGLQRNAVRMLTKLGPKAKSAAPVLKAMLTETMKGQSIDPYLIIQCLKKIDASAEVIQILIEGLNSADRNTREEVRYLLQDVYGASALASLDAAVANGQLRETPELTSLMKQLRPRPASVNQ